ncbi:Gfo/Idh/MocA family oxidoreductase [Chitinophaga alhagiae]|uniref:Gfo/Idh/MocA family oxidoreductase n=1 Tax=Chitinophaga alhagiae TaxID=2203219 RepID=UPI000E5B825D|nr:Gfo/Idh/MocA family oxidoreductase [Chitinophaga alhagiae]
MTHTRRTFLHASAMAGAAVLTAPLAGLALPRQQKKLGIALMGLGGYATNQLAPALQQTQHIELRGIVTGTPSKIPLWTEKYKIPEKNVYNYDNFDKIADNKDIDVVYVVLPNSMHAEFTIRAAKAGKHVICEKPMAVSVKEGQAMIDACKKAGRQLAIGYRLHYDPFHLEMMRLSREKVFGEVKLVEASDGFRAGDPNQWRLKHALSGGGPLMDVGIYAIQGARYTVGLEPAYVTAQAFPKTDPVKFKDVEESLSWQLYFPNGAIANSFSTYITGVNRLYAAAEKGWFEINNAYGYRGQQGRTSQGAMQITPINQQAAHMDGVAKAILEGRPNNVPGEEGLRDMKVIEAIYASMAAGGKKLKIG